MKKSIFLLALCTLALVLLTACGGQTQSQDQPYSFTGGSWQVQQASGIRELDGVSQSLIRMATVRFEADGSGSISALMMKMPFAWSADSGRIRLQVNGTVYGPVSYTVSGDTMEISGEGLYILLTR